METYVRVSPEAATGLANLFQAAERAKQDLNLALTMTQAALGVSTEWKYNVATGEFSPPEEGAQDDNADIDG